MSYANGMAALNLEMPDIVPRTEYSAEKHWDLIKAVTGITTQDQAASSAFLKAWDYGMYWNILMKEQYYGSHYTKMGHANYAYEGSDFDDQLQCPFEDIDDVLDFDPSQQYGIPDHKKIVSDFEENYKLMQKIYPDTVNMTGIYTTCMSGLIEMFGWDLLLEAAGCEPEKFGAVTNRYADWVMHYFRALAECSAPVVMVHDDIVWTDGAFIHPDWYKKYIFPNLKRYFDVLREGGKKIIFTSDGNYTQFIDDIAQCGVNAFVMEPMTDMAAMAEKYGKTHGIIGNVDTRVLLSGTKEEIYGEVKRCMDIGRDCPGFFLAVGNHIPANTPVENALYYNECYEKMKKR